MVKTETNPATGRQWLSADSPLWSKMSSDQLVTTDVKPTSRCERTECGKFTEVLYMHVVEDQLLGVCPSCHVWMNGAEVVKAKAKAAITKAFGDYSSGQKARVKIGSIEVKGQFRGDKFYVYPHLVKKFKLSYSYHATAVEVVEKY